jgi:tetratricopeptide (TPR) repeat protein
VPLDWAMTQNNLGNALGERESGTARLEEAVAAYRAALEEWKREYMPLDWAMTQNNLGNALWALGERESGTARLEEAVAAFRAVLEEMTASPWHDIASHNLASCVAILEQHRKVRGA